MIDMSQELEEGTGAAQTNGAFFKLDLKDESEQGRERVHKWLVAKRQALAKANEPRFEKIKRNLALNKGLMYSDQDTKSGSQAADAKKRAVEKIVVNVLREANRVRASRILKYKPAVAILPNNDELGDKVAAEATGKLKDHIWYEQRFDGEKLPEVVDAKGTMGECFLFIEWNPNLGDLHQEYKKARAFAQENGRERVVLLGEDGNPEKNENGEEVVVDRPVRNGDVEYTVEHTMNLLFHRPPSRRWKESEYVFRSRPMEVEKARLRWPDAADKIKGNKETRLWDAETFEEYSDDTLCEVVYFYHRRTEECDKGALIVFTADGVLDVQEFPYSHRNLPCVRWVDMLNPGEQHGVSFFDDVKGPAGAFNNITNMILRNEVMVGHPKWMMPTGAAKLEELGNAITVVQYKGVTPPALVQANPTGQGAYSLKQSLEDLVMRQADVSRTGNGQPPQGVTAAVALQYLSELEAERWNAPVLFHNEAVLQTVIMTLGVAGDYYDPTDKRMIRVQGNDGAWVSEFFEASNLSKDYDVRVQGSSALPESKAARIETLLQLAKQFPDRVDSEQVLDQFEFAQSNKFISEGTLSLRAAEAENEMILTQKQVGDPVEYEDQVTHWKTHVRKMREWSFKNRTPKQLQEKLEGHVRAHEMIMVAQAMKNPALQQVLASLPGFPLFFAYQDETGDAAGDEERASAAGATAPLPPMPPGPADAPEGPAVGPMQAPPEEPVQQGQPVPELQDPGNLPEQAGLEQQSQQPTNGF